MNTEMEFLTHKLRKRADTNGDDIALGFLDDGEEITQSLTFGELDARVHDLASVLLDRLSAGERILLLFPPGLDFVVAFLACLRSGRIAVPAIPPEPHKPARSLSRLYHLVENSRPALVLTSTFVAQFRPVLETSIPALAQLPWIDVTDVPRLSRRIDDPRDEGVAFLQYTSGSTAEPKGVRILRRNLTHNLHVIHGVAPAKPIASVSWLPQFHDMGLIEGILLPLDGGWPAWLMPPWAFLNRPISWLRAIEKFGATRSGGPNFAYDLCTRRISMDDRAKLDLSCWQQAYCGAEPIRAGTLAAFAKAFAPARFSVNCFFPCYGLAEHTVLASCRTHEPYLVERISTAELARGKAVHAHFDERAVDVVCVGEIPPAVSVHIVDGHDKPLEDGHIGEVYLQSGSVADGYWQNEIATAEIFGATLTAPSDNGHFLRTGDLGYRRANQLFIVGRRKDVLIVHGTNHYAHDVERAAEAAHLSIRRGCVCAVMLDGSSESEYETHPAVICEVDGAIDDDKRLSITTSVHRAVMYEHGISVDVVLVPKQTLPKTSSGKLQRRAAAQMIHEGTIAKPLRTVIAVAAHDEDDTLQKVKSIICRIAGLSPQDVDLDLPPSRLPLDSLHTFEIMTAMNSLLGRTISLTSWSTALSLRDLARGVIALERPWIHDLDKPLPNFLKSRDRRNGAILVTGGSGLIGKALVTALKQQGTQVFVLARSVMASEGLTGDITKSKFGLDEPAYRQLVSSVDTVIHLAGAINWVLPYASLAPTNVDGTVHVLAFCAEARARLVHVSSQIVCHGNEAHPGMVVDDLESAETLRERIACLPLGYAQSKAVSEYLVHRAQKGGLDATIVRPALVPAAIDNATPADIISILVRAFIESGIAPDVDWPFSVCPNNHLVQMLASLVDHGPPLAHITDERHSSREVIAWLVMAGYDVRLVPWDEWMWRIEAIGLHQIAPLCNLWPLLRSGALLTYARPNRAKVLVNDAFRVIEPVDPAFIDERLRAWQNSGWLPRPKRQGARATATSRATPETPRRVCLNGQSHDVVKARVGPIISGGGILSRLSAGFCDRPIGVFPATLTLDDGRELDVVLKASARGDELRALCASVARASSPTLAAALDKLGEWLDVGAADARERAVYSFTNGSLARYLPRCHSSFESFDQDAPLVLERLRAGQQVEMLDAVNTPWSFDQIKRVVESLANMHAAYRDRLDKLTAIPWARPARTTAQMLMPLWEALFAHARTQINPDVAATATRLLDAPTWSDSLATMPLTLLHNDANPRNLALRCGAASGIVLYDWELSTIGPATRDLAEWLCFTLSPATNHCEALDLVRTHGRIAVPNLDDDTLLAAFHASLAWFFFDRLTTYTVVSPIYDLPWLPRVFSTWQHLVKHFDPKRLS